MWTRDPVRVWMYEAIHAVLNRVLLAPVREMLEISPVAASPLQSIVRTVWGPEVQVTEAHYPAVDAERLPYPEAAFDLVAADQVFEHIQRPWLAAAQVTRVTRRGGLAVITAPFFHPVHRAPRDCWRFGPEAWPVLFPPEDWQTLEIGGWGDAALIAWEYAHNPQLSDPALPGYTGPRAPPAAIPGYGPEQDDGLNPIVVWWIGGRR